MALPYIWIERLSWDVSCFDCNHVGGLASGYKDDNDIRWRAVCLLPLPFNSCDAPCHVCIPEVEVIFFSSSVSRTSQHTAIPETS